MSWFHITDLDGMKIKTQKTEADWLAATCRSTYVTSRIASEADNTSTNRLFVVFIYVSRTAIAAGSYLYPLFDLRLTLRLHLFRLTSKRNNTLYSIIFKAKCLYKQKDRNTSKYNTRPLHRRD